MLAQGEYLYVASTWGCLIVLDNATMTPHMTFRPHGDVAPYIRFLLPLSDQPRLEMMTSQDDVILSSPEEENEITNGILSIGMGYRHLVAKHVKSGPAQLSVKQTDVCLLSWLSDHWKYTCTADKE